MRQVQRLVFLLIVISCSTTSILAGDIPDWVPPDAVEAANRLWREDIKKTSLHSLNHFFGFKSTEEGLACTLANPVQLATILTGEYDPSEPPGAVYELHEEYRFFVYCDSLLLASIHIGKVGGGWKMRTMTFLLANPFSCDFAGQMYEKYGNVDNVRIISRDLDEYHIFKDGVPTDVYTCFSQTQSYKRRTAREWLEREKQIYDRRMQIPRYREILEEEKRKREESEKENKQRSGGTP